LIQYDLQHTHTCVTQQTHTHTHDTPAIEACVEHMTTSQHRGSLTAPYDKCNTQTVTTSQQHVTKNFRMKSIYTRGDRNNLYIMTSSICNTSRQTFFSHDSPRPILGMNRRAFSDIVQNTLPQVTNQHRHVLQQTKTKVLTRNHP
jgi:hypothetical protein